VILEELNMTSTGGFSQVSVNGHRTLSMRAMQLENVDFSISSSNDTSTELDNVDMYYTVSRQHYSLLHDIRLNSGISVTNSRLSDFWQIKLGLNTPGASSIFENCVFNFVRNNAGSNDYLINTPANGSLQVKNCTFQYVNVLYPFTSTRGAIQAKGGFDLENITVTGFNGHSYRPLLSIDGSSYLYRIKIGSSSYNGQPLGSLLGQPGFQSLIERTGGAVLTPEL
jgi:hypothetical protein